MFVSPKSCTRDDRREKIVAAGNNVRQALQDLLGQYLANAGKVPSEQLDIAIDIMCQRTQDLRYKISIVISLFIAGVHSNILF